MSIPDHLQSAEQLVTTRSEVRAGFVAMALEKNKRAIPFVEEGRSLHAAATKVKKASDLLTVSSIRPALLTASGLSDKALNLLEESEKEDAVTKLIEEFLDPAGDDFVDELVYRFLLIKGDSLGGAMRNVAGFLAEQLFKRAIISALSVQGKDFHWCSKKFRQWARGDAPMENTEDIIGMSWVNAYPRTIVFNKTVKLINKNIDICLLSEHYQEIEGAMDHPEKYILLGELKGGIDPAGADEHWKTARTSIERIIQGFGKKNIPVKTLFIGAAIEKSMADEIWSWLENGKLSNAGNLKNQSHVASICNWLVEL